MTLSQDAPQRSWRRKRSAGSGVGIDIWEGAHRLVEQRLQSAAGLFGKVTFTDQAPERTDGGETAVETFDVPERRSIPREPWQRMSRKAIFGAAASVARSLFLEDPRNPVL